MDNWLKSRPTTSPCDVVESQPDEPGKSDSEYFHMLYNERPEYFIVCAARAARKSHGRYYVLTYINDMLTLIMKKNLRMLIFFITFAIEKELRTVGHRQAKAHKTT